MPKDEWARARRKDIARRAASHPGFQQPTRKKLRKPVVIPAGTRVLVKRNDSSEECKPHTTHQQLKFTHFHAASKKALMFTHGDWVIWVSKELLGY